MSGVKSPLASLDGTWKFNPAPPAGFEKFLPAQTVNSKSIAVPSEWVMQGFEVNTNSAAAYWREFQIPPNRQGRRIKLLFDTVHSDCQIYLNRLAVGAHEGCFTAFEFDITGTVKADRNTLVRCRICCLDSMAAAIRAS